jgi:hypothetical protein
MATNETPLKPFIYIVRYIPLSDTELQAQLLVCVTLYLEQH